MSVERTKIESIRNELSDLRDRLEDAEADAPDAIARMIVRAAAGSLTTAMIALDHPDVRPLPAAVTESPPPAADQVVDLMNALERSVADAKEARSRHPKPGGTRLDDILSEDQITELAREFDR
jgi:hypothetical protein